MTQYKITVWCESDADEPTLAAALEQGGLRAVCSGVRYQIDCLACLACGAERPPDASAQHWRGPYCRACAERWRYHGYPEGGPPPPRHVAPGTRAGRLEDYAELRAQGVPLKEAAKRMGVHKRTAEKYDADLRDAGRLAT